MYLIIQSSQIKSPSVQDCHGTFHSCPSTIYFESLQYPAQSFMVHWSPMHNCCSPTHICNLPNALEILTDFIMPTNFIPGSSKSTTYTPSTATSLKAQGSLVSYHTAVAIHKQLHAAAVGGDPLMASKLVSMVTCSPVTLPAMLHVGEWQSTLLLINRWCFFLSQ